MPGPWGLPPAASDGNSYRSRPPLLLLTRTILEDIPAYPDTLTYIPLLHYSSHPTEGIHSLRWLQQLISKWSFDDVIMSFGKMFDVLFLVFHGDVVLVMFSCVVSSASAAANGTSCHVHFAFQAFHGVICYFVLSRQLPWWAVLLLCFVVVGVGVIGRGCGCRCVCM